MPEKDLSALFLDTLKDTTHWLRAAEACCACREKGRPGFVKGTTDPFRLLWVTLDPASFDWNAVATLAV